jgi:hypothetical protein
MDTWFDGGGKFRWLLVGAILRSPSSFSRTELGFAVGFGGGGKCAVLFTGGGCDAIRIVPFPSVGYVPLVLVAVPNEGKSFADMERAFGIDPFRLAPTKELSG